MISLKTKQWVEWVPSYVPCNQCFYLCLGLASIWTSTKCYEQWSSQSCWFFLDNMFDFSIAVENLQFFLNALLFSVWASSSHTSLFVDNVIGIRGGVGIAISSTCFPLRFFLFHVRVRMHSVGLEKEHKFYLMSWVYSEFRFWRWNR